MESPNHLDSNNVEATELIQRAGFRRSSDPELRETSLAQPAAELTLNTDKWPFLFSFS